MAAAPFLALASLAIVLETPGSPFFLHERVGLEGRRFRLWKLRTMRVGAGPEVTAAGDQRITRVGRLLRLLKLDEVPQLWNGLRGDMAFVGPRPDAPSLVDPENEMWRDVLSVRPGITDPVTLSLRNEESLLAEVEGDRELFYRQRLQPFKLKGYIDYLQTRTILRDLGVILKTVLSTARVLRIPATTLAQIENREGGDPDHS